MTAIDQAKEEAREIERRYAAGKKAQQDAPTDADIQAMWDEACKDTPQAPGWNRHIRFARALLARYAPAQDAEQAIIIRSSEWNALSPEAQTNLLKMVRDFTRNCDEESGDETVHA